MFIGFRFSKFFSTVFRVLSAALFQREQKKSIFYVVNALNVSQWCVEKGWHNFKWFVTYIIYVHISL